MRKITLAFSLLAVLMLSGCVFMEFGFDWDDYRFKFDENHEFELGDIEKLALKLRNGRIYVTPYEGDKILVDVEERIKADDEEEAAEIAEAIDLRNEMHGNTLKLETDFQNNQKWRRRYACIVTVKIPADIDLNLETSNGRIEIGKMAGKVIARSSNGRIEIDGATGEVELYTSNGSISALNIEGSIYADTSNGTITIFSTKGDVTAETSNGKIKVVITNQLDGDVKLSTSNGSVTLELDNESDFSIVADTSNGHISDDFNNADFEYNKRRNFMKGKAGSGKHEVTIDTSNGSISIHSK